MYFFLHKSIFLQATLLFLLFTISLLIIHYKCKKFSDETLIKLTSERKSSTKFDFIEDKLLMIGKINKNNLFKFLFFYLIFLDCKKGNNSCDDSKQNYFFNNGLYTNETVLKVEDKKFDKFIELLEDSFYVKNTKANSTI
jgi:hypothetical protein